MEITKSGIHRLAHFGARPEFDTMILVSQGVLPDWNQFESEFTGIFDRQYYNNNGPMLTAFERKLEKQLGVAHAICVANTSLSFLVAMEALRVRGNVAVSAAVSADLIAALHWVGLQPSYFYTRDSSAQSADAVRKAFEDAKISAIVGHRSVTGGDDSQFLQSLADALNIPLIFDSSDAFACSTNGIAFGGAGKGEIFSFSGGEIIDTMEGGCITTNDDEFYQYCVGIRPSYGIPISVAIDKVANARMSEGQAVLGLASLERMQEQVRLNTALHALYHRLLNPIKGIALNNQPSGFTSTSQKFSVFLQPEFGLSVDRFIQCMKAEGIEVKKVSDQLSPAIGQDSQALMVGDAQVFRDRHENRLLLPCGPHVSTAAAERICAIIAEISQQAEGIIAHEA